MAQQRVHVGRRQAAGAQQRPRASPAPLPRAVCRYLRAASQTRTPTLLLDERPTRFSHRLRLLQTL